MIADHRMYTYACYIYNTSNYNVEHTIKKVMEQYGYSLEDTTKYVREQIDSRGPVYRFDDCADW